MNCEVPGHCVTLQESAIISWLVFIRILINIPVGNGDNSESQRMHTNSTRIFPRYLSKMSSSVVITLFSKMTAILTFFGLRFQLNTLKNNSKVENSNSDKYSILAKRLLWTNIRVHYKCISCRLPSSSVQWDSRWQAAGT